MCIYNKLIRNKKYTRTKKNGGNIPPIKDPRVQFVPIGCGNCIECRKQKAREWQVRLTEDIKHNKNAKFITLTFSDQSIAQLAQEFPKYKGYALDNIIATRAMRLFNERYRKKYKKALRHWMVTELGHQGTENIHLHGIIWATTNLDEIEKLWKYGHIWKGKGEKKTNYVNAQTVNYIVKYVNKTDEKHKFYKSIILTSPGIGRGYTKTYNFKTNKFKNEQTDETYRTPDGHRIALPIYYRNKLYTDDQREQLWLNKLDKEERWVCGIKVDVSKGEQEYNELVDRFRKLNEKLGYGNQQKDYEREKYENDLRILKQQTRIAKGKRLMPARQVKHRDTD